jgi:hypothetical protein
VYLICPKIQAIIGIHQFKARDIMRRAEETVYYKKSGSWQPGIFGRQQCIQKVLETDGLKNSYTGLQLPSSIKFSELPFFIFFAVSPSEKYYGN